MLSSLTLSVITKRSNREVEMIGNETFWISARDMWRDPYIKDCQLFFPVRIFITLVSVPIHCHLVLEH